MRKPPQIIVVGGGAAGITAAWRAANLGARVTILEKTSRLGTKILISGGGKCNITHAGPIPEVLSAYRKNEAAFLRPSFYRFTNVDIQTLLQHEGLELYTRTNGRVFPVGKTAKDVMAILARLLSRLDIDVRFETPCLGLGIVGAAAVGVETAKGPLRADAVIVAAGGSSYPGSGTTGDAWPWLREAGHTVIKVRAALAPINLVNASEWSELAGVAFRDRVLKARQGTKVLARWRDDTLVTHQGISGPCALGISREVAEAAGGGPVQLSLDLLPDHSFEQVAERVGHWIDRNPRKSLLALCPELVPESVAPLMLARSGIEPGKPSSQLAKRSRNRYVETCKDFVLGQVRDVPIEKGEVVAGGVDLDEVDPHTMASRRIRNLFLCGEVLDVAGPVGGYNLQAAWSSGFVAGESAAQLSEG